MSPIIAAKQTEIEALCQRYKVKRLDMFGSAAAASFDPDVSDLDFLVTFGELQPGEYADTYFGLLEKLESWFQPRFIFAFEDLRGWAREQRTRLGIAQPAVVPGEIRAIPG